MLDMILLVYGEWEGVLPPTIRRKSHECGIELTARSDITPSQSLATLSTYQVKPAEIVSLA